MGEPGGIQGQGHVRTKYPPPPALHRTCSTTDEGGTRGSMPRDMSQHNNSSCHALTLPCMHLHMLRGTALPCSRTGPQGMGRCMKSWSGPGWRRTAPQHSRYTHPALQRCTAQRGRSGRWHWWIPRRTRTCSYRKKHIEEWGPEQGPTRDVAKYIMPCATAGSPRVRRIATTQTHMRNSQPLYSTRETLPRGTRSAAGGGGKSKCCPVLPSRALWACTGAQATQGVCAHPTQVRRHLIVGPWTSQNCRDRFFIGWGRGTTRVRACMTNLGGGGVQRE